MLDYNEAPYLELANYKAPKDAKFLFVPMKDKKNIRLAYWQYNTDLNKSKGTILLQQGHNEFIEKYYETINDFLEEGYNVISFDWRGQGMSDRMLSDINIQFTENFDTYNEDFTFILNEIVKPYFPQPLIGIGHSMGGCLLLSSLDRHQEDFSHIILSAPMLGFKKEMLLSSMLRVSSLLFKKESYVPLSKPNMGKETPFLENDLTYDHGRYERTLRLVRMKPQIRLWGVSIAWGIAAIKRLKKIRTSKWLDKINSKILFINSLEDKVVNPKSTMLIQKKLKNSKIINLSEIKHEIFMEKDDKRGALMNEIFKFIENKE